jgi:putative transposase
MYLVFAGPLCKHGFMQRLLSFLPVLAIRFFRSRRDLLLENLALRQQLAVLKLRHPQPRFAASDKWFWVMLCRLWPGWKQALILVQPETVVGWHRAGFKLYWRWLSRLRHIGANGVALDAEGSEES